MFISSKFWLVTILVLFAASTGISGQDLGSSNSLFGGKKSSKGSAPAKKATTVKKAATKTKTASTRTKTAPRQTRAVSKPKPANRPEKTAKKTDAVKTDVQTSKLEPAPVKPPSLITAPTAEANELFEKLIVEGNAARDERSYSLAESKYQQAKKTKSNDSRAVYGLGNLYSDQQRWEDAENAYRAALKLDQSSAIINVALSYVLSQPVMVANLSDRYEEAEKFARRAIELAPSNALAFDQLGVSMELCGIISKETEDAYRNAIRLDPSFAPSYAHLGRLLRRRGMSSDSAKAYEGAVKRATDVPTMIVVADVMQSEQRFAESEPLLRRAVESDPKNPSGLLLLGKALTTLGKFDDAERFLRKSLVVSPNGFMPNCLLGTLYERQGKLEMAENSLLQAQQFVSPNEKRNLSLRFETVGDGYMKAGKAKNAERSYKQALSLDPEKQSLAGKLAKSQRS